ncbi:11beta-hydroxysteroid dehydrogenase [Sarracenia purpurea var. burkii]
MARRESQLQKVADTAREMGSPDVLSVCGDVSNIDDCKRFIDEAVNHFGRLDHLVNNAGINRICAFEDANDVTKLTPVMDVNFWGAIYPTYFAIPHLKKNRGKIVVNATTGALLHPPKLSIYTASKAALICFYETMRVELGPAISITIVTPGFIQTEMTQGKRLPVDGVVKRNRGLFRNGFIGALPHMSSKSCAIAIVEATCRGARYVTEPKWYRPLYVLKYICPELFEWSYRAFFFKSRVSDPSKQPKRD